MKDYRKIPFSKIKCIEEYTKLMLEKGYVIVQALIDDECHQIIEEICYGIEKAAPPDETFLACLFNEEKELCDRVFVDYAAPTYVNEGYNTSRYFLSLDAFPFTISLFDFEREISCMEKHFEEKCFSPENKPNKIRHYEFYVSKHKQDFYDFFWDKEFEFLEDWSETNKCFPRKMIPDASVLFPKVLSSH